MFSDKNRLRHDRDVARVLRSKHKVFDACAGIKFAENKGDHCRFTVVVGTKVNKSAVVRNRVKRQYRDIIKGLLPELKTGFDVVVLVSKPAVELEYKQKQEKLTYVFKKARLLKG